MENMKMTVVKMLQAGQAVFFGCDVLQQEDKKLGVLDVDLYDYEVSQLFTTAFFKITNPIMRRRPSESLST